MMWNDWNRRKEMSDQTFGDYALGLMGVKDEHPDLVAETDATVAYIEISRFIHDIVPKRTS